MDRKLSIPGPRLTMALLSQTPIKNPTSRPNMDSDKLATMRRTIIKNKYLSEMKIDEIKLKVQSKCENRLPNADANNDSSHSDQDHIIQRKGIWNHKILLRSKLM